MDAKMNKKVSLDELKADLVNHKAILAHDTDGDEFLNKAELKTYLETNGLPTDTLDAVFTRIDLDGDEKISLGE
jgi:hypothetical protein